MRMRFVIDLPKMKATPEGRAQALAEARRQGYPTFEALIASVADSFRTVPLKSDPFLNFGELRDEQDNVVRWNYEGRAVARWTDSLGNIVFGTANGDEITVVTLDLDE